MGSGEAIQDSPNERVVFDRKIIFNFGIIFFFVLLIPVIIYDYLSITITAQFGHIGLYENSGALSSWAAANSYFRLQSLWFYSVVTRKRMAGRGCTIMR